MSVQLYTCDCGNVQSVENNANKKCCICNTNLCKKCGCYEIESDGMCGYCVEDNRSEEDPDPLTVDGDTMCDDVCDGKITSLSDGMFGLAILAGILGITDSQLMFRREYDEDEYDDLTPEEKQRREVMKQGSAFLKEYDAEFQKCQEQGKSMEKFMKTHPLKKFQNGKWVDSTLHQVFASRKSD